MTDPEDAKLITLARAARARNGTRQGAAIRDLDGRAYTATDVKLPSFEVDAIDLAVAMAVSSGATGLESAVVVTEPDRLVNLDTVRDLGGTDIEVLVVDQEGETIAVKRT